MICPKCNAELESTQIADVNVDVCSQCMGYWFDPGELRALAQKFGVSEEQARALEDAGHFSEEGQAQMVCPKCSDRTLYPGKVHGSDARWARCSTCYGLWLAEKGDWKREKLIKVVVDVLQLLLGGI